MEHGKHRIRFSTKIVVASVAAIVIFTAFVLFMELLNIANKTAVQVPTELIVSWYAFWTVELVSLASIRKTKIRNKYEDE